VDRVGSLAIFGRCDNASQLKIDRLIYARCVRLALFALLLAAAAYPAKTLACAACACGDPTLTVAGTEKPFAGRLRISLELQHRSDRVGIDRVDRVELSEQRLELGLAYAPIESLVLSLRAPLIHRTITEVNLAEDRRTRLGDTEFRAQLHLIPRTGLTQKHVFAIHAGLELPTGSVERDDRGELYRAEIQPGSGSFDPLAGASYALFLRPISLYASSTLFVPTRGHEGLRGGLSLRSSVAGQYDLSDSWALRLSIDTRAEAASTFEDGDVEPDTGGFIAYLSPELVASPVMDLIVRVVVRVPAINALTGDHREGLMAVLGAAYDF
jgi:hypothetical protein